MEESAIRITMPCTFVESGMYHFITGDNISVADRFRDKLDKYGVGCQRGNLFFEFKEKGKGLQKIERKGVLFRVPGFRLFITTPENYEAFNILKNKIVRRGVVNQSGRLGFEFVPIPEENPKCVCRHSYFAHRYYNHVIICDVVNCKCREYRGKTPILVFRKSS
jgi:hypothetical protein